MHFHGEVYVFHTNYRGVHMSDRNTAIVVQVEIHWYQSAVCLFDFNLSMGVKRGGKDYSTGNDARDNKKKIVW